MRSNCGIHFVKNATSSPGTTEELATELKSITFKEARLQKLLDENPKIIPAERLGFGFTPLISLGREICKIDNLFVSPYGRLTVVETKLWRNPESMRKVLAQILDYAGELSMMSYEELQVACHTASGSPLNAGESLYDFVARNNGARGTLPEQDFVDELQRNLRNGRFLLLIIGDGIREDLERILGQLHQYSNLQFTFGLVEIKICDLPGNAGRIAIPQIVAHSTEVVRATVQVEQDDSDKTRITIATGGEGVQARLAELDFVEGVKSKAAREIFLRFISWGRNNPDVKIRSDRGFLTFQVRIGAGGEKAPIVHLNSNGKIRLTPGLLRNAIRDRTMLGDAKFTAIASSFSRLLDLPLNESKNWLIDDVDVSILEGRVEQVLEVYDANVEELKNIQLRDN